MTRMFSVLVDPFYEFTLTFCKYHANILQKSVFLSNTNQTVSIYQRIQAFKSLRTNKKSCQSICWQPTFFPIQIMCILQDAMCIQFSLKYLLISYCVLITANTMFFAYYKRSSLTMRSLLQSVNTNNINIS